MTIEIEHTVQIRTREGINYTVGLALEIETEVELDEKIVSKSIDRQSRAIKYVIKRMIFDDN